MKANVSRVLVIFPFEEELYRRAGVPVQFVGHPLVDLAREQQARPAFLRDLGLLPDAPTVALLPGSRRNELQRIAPTMAAALPLIRARVPDVQFVIAGAPGLPEHVFAPFFARDSGFGIQDSPGGVQRSGGSRIPGSESRLPVLVHGRTDDVIAASDVVITASGTATVQCALHERPMVVVYRLSSLDYQMGKRFVTNDTYAMPNLVAGQRIVPELIQDEFTPERVAEETVALLTDHGLHARTREALGRVREQLGRSGASARAADAVLEVARGAKSK